MVDHREPWVTDAIWNAKARMTDETGTLARSAVAIERSAKLVEPIHAELALAASRVAKTLPVHIGDA
ncbi:hypothetical protein [Salinispora fenicalii]|uniref:hypothetical protein n=1 Tax=Salinispora fenicalii TaxID=1137263 RepID=UPI000489929B